MDITAYNNEHGTASIDVTSWAAVYDLSTVPWSMQVRETAKSPNTLLELSSGDSTILYAEPVVTFDCPQALAGTVPAGAWVWEFGFTTSSEFIRVGGGTFTMVQGVVR